MGAVAQLHVLASERSDLAVAQAGLDGDEQDRPIPSSDPFAQVRCSEECGDLLLGEELEKSTFVAFAWNRLNTLTVKNVSRFAQCHILEEGTQRG